MAPAPAVEAPAASSTEASATPSVEAAKTGLSSEGIGSGNASMIEPAEGAEMLTTGRGVPAQNCGHVNRRRD
jgi:hypothetical protein